MYHGITAKPSFSGFTNHSGMQLDVNKFDQQIKFLSQNYNVLFLSDIIKRIKLNKDIPTRAAVITFDDGYENNYTQAFPVLRKFNTPATIFLATEYINDSKLFWPDKLEVIFETDAIQQLIPLKINVEYTISHISIEALKHLINYLKTLPEIEKEQIITYLENLTQVRYSNSDHDYRTLRWHQVQSMLNSGLIEFGTHTHRHIILTKFDSAEAAEEINLSKEILENHIGQSVKLFSYPNGSLNDFNSATQKYLEAAGYECALLTVEGFNGADSDLFRVKRIGIHNDHSMAAFESKLCGFQTFIDKLKPFHP